MCDLVVCSVATQFSVLSEMINGTADLASVWLLWICCMGQVRNIAAGWKKGAGWYIGMSWFLQFSLHVLRSQEIIKAARSYPQVKWESCLCHCWTDGIRVLLGHSISPYVPCISEAVSGICLFSQFLAIWNSKITPKFYLFLWRPQETTESFPPQLKGLKISFPFLFFLKWDGILYVS